MLFYLSALFLKEVAPVGWFRVFKLLSLTSLHLYIGNIVRLHICLDLSGHEYV